MRHKNKTLYPVPLQFYIDRPTAKRLRKRAAEERLAVSAWLRRMIAVALETRREADTPSHRAQQPRQEVLAGQ
jgi:hypothetical protein